MKRGPDILGIRKGIGKARRTCTKLWPVWRSRKYSRNTKFKIYQACVLFVLSTLRNRMTVHDLKKLQSFHAPCLRAIFHIFWPTKVSNNEISKLTGQDRRTWELFVQKPLALLTLHSDGHHRVKERLEKDCTGRTSGPKR